MGQTGQKTVSIDAGDAIAIGVLNVVEAAVGAEHVRRAIQLAESEGAATRGSEDTLVAGGSKVLSARFEFQPRSGR